jgi:protein-S-isoprenylcysteine O-methyltransferase Ste14
MWISGPVPRKTMQIMATFRRNVVVSILVAAVGGPGTSLLWVPLAVTRFRVPAGEPRWQMALAALLILTGVSPDLDSIRRFVIVGHGTLMPTVPTVNLVVSGFYRYVRNPMYVGVLIALSGEILLFRSRGLLLFAPLLWLAFHLFIRLYEEPTLTRRYGEEYLRFQQNVPRWLPRLKPWEGGGS